MLIAFTGHRPNKLGGYDDRINKRAWFDNKLAEYLQSVTCPIEFIVGMAQGVDQWAAEYAVRNNIPFHAYIPFKGQEKMWPQSAQKRYSLILTWATSVKYICPLGYASWKMQQRNEAMVNDCNLLIAVWNGTPGGTANCVAYANRIRKPIIRFFP